MRKFISREALIDKLGFVVSEQYYCRICEDFAACSLAVEEFMETYPFDPPLEDDGTETEEALL